MLDLNIGNVELLKGLNVALDMAHVGSPAADIEEALWRAVSEGFDHEHNSTVVIDGLDHVSGGQRAALKILERLRSVTKTRGTVKTIVLSTPIGQATIPETRHFNLEPRLVQADIRLFVRSLAEASPQMASLTEDERAKIVEQISVPADGSFIWAKITFATIVKQNTFAAILKSLETTAKGLELALERLVFSLDLQHSDTRSVLAWMLAAERPLHLKEIKTLLELNPAEGHLSPRFSNVEDDVQKAVGDIVIIQDGYVRFIHSSVRAYLLELAESVTDLSNSGKFPFMIKEAHFDVATRCMNYLKTFFTRSAEPAITPVPSEMITDLFRDSPLLEYCVRYWSIHVEQSPMYQPDGKHKLAATFKKNFTNSVFLAILERSCWEEQVPSSLLMHMHTTALSLRAAVFGPEEPAVLQNMLTIASLFKKLDERNNASDAFYEAYELSLKVFGEQSKVTTDCAIGFLDSTNSVKITSRNSTSDRLERILIFIIDAMKTRGRTSVEEVLKYSTTLAELYNNTDQQDKAATLWRRVYEMSIETYGSYDSLTSKTYATLLATLKRLDRQAEMAEVQRFAYDKARKSLSVSDSKRHELAFDMIQLYESQNNAAGAEEILIDEWQSLTKAAESNAAFHGEKLALAVQYAQFLRKHQRTSEAQNILRGTWSEYKDRSDVRTETNMATFVSMAQEMRQLEMVETAHSILLSAWNESKVSSQQSSLTQTIASELLQTTQHIVTTKTESTTEVDMSVEETILQDIAETSSVSTSTDVNSREVKKVVATFQTSDSLSTFYLRQSRWPEAIRTCSKFLQGAWPALLEDKQTGKIALPEKSQTEAILLATRLAECHFNTGETVDSERLLQNVFTASKNSLPYTDERLSSAATTLIKFLESTHQFSKALKVHDELYNLVKEKSGPSSEQTISAANDCAKYCVSHGMRKEAEKYYLTVYTHLSKDTDVLPEPAFEAAQWLEDFYRRENRWKDLRPIYTKIWNTILARGKQYGITSDYIDRFYSSYIDALKTRYDATYDQIRDTTIQFRDTTAAIFGPSHELALRSTYELAEVNEQNEKHREEAVELYKSIMTETDKRKTSSALSSKMLTIVRRTKKQVAQHYTSSTTTSKQAVNIFVEEYQSSATQLGFAHKTTLEQQHQLVTALTKENTAESKTRALQILEHSVANIVSNEKDSQKLFDSATQVANSYIETGNRDAAIILLSKLRRALIFDEPSKDLKIKLNRSDRTSYAFVSAYELVLYPQRQFSEIMSELMTETMRYEAYHRAIKEKASLIVILVRGTQLLEHLESKQQKNEYTHVRNDILKIFKTHLGVTVQDAQLSAFFEIVIAHIVEVEARSTVLEAVVEKVRTDISQSHFREAYEIALLESKFMQLSNELSTSENVRQGFNLALYLSGRGTKRSEDADLAVQMLQLSKTILTLVIAASKTLHVKFSSMNLDEINLIAGLMGLLEMYADLEQILTDVWIARHNQNTWSSSTVVSLGRRLIEVRVAAGMTESAIHLCEDIIYNLRRVWGELDATTLTFWSLLAELYSVTGNFHAAQNVHEDILHQSIHAVEDGDVTADRGAAVAAAHLDLLKLSYQRATGWAKDSHVYSDLQSQLRAEFGKEVVWTKSASATQNVDKWSKTAPKTDAGLWKKPTSWEFVTSDDATQHQNHLRKISGISGSFAASTVTGQPKNAKLYPKELSGAKVATK